MPKVVAVSVETSETPESFKEDIGTDGKTKWSDTPTLADQLQTHPKTCRKLPPQVEVFNLSDAEELKAYNSRLGQTVPREAPQIVMQEQQQFHAGIFYAMVRFQKIEYKVLLALK